MKITANKNNTNWSPAYIILAIAIACFTGVFLVHGADESSVRLNVRLTARFAITCFSLAFVESSFHLLFKNSISTWLVRNRKQLGVSFAIIHLIHLLFLVILQQRFHPVFGELFAIVFGGLAYAFVVLMLLTSFDVCAKLISRDNWNRLHTIGGYWILIVFSNSMLGRLASGDLEYLPWGIMVLSVWILRLLAWRRRAKS